MMEEKERIWSAVLARREGWIQHTCGMADPDSSSEESLLPSKNKVLQTEAPNNSGWQGQHSSLGPGRNISPSLRTAPDMVRQGWKAHILPPALLSSGFTCRTSLFKGGENLQVQVRVQAPCTHIQTQGKSQLERDSPAPSQEGPA